ncbi:MAG TPA: UDP-N-acetylglucosamine 1-carboxyvinyltransferase [Clostridiales bacterium]|nr:UDP-N-acetylglucosamine 1-carboxyvinyltransferase [Clostridiales bacterium]
MDALRITGRRRLKGSVNIGGAKNAVLPIMAAAMMVDGEVVLKNVPQLTDVTAMCTILRALGIAVKAENDILIINAESVKYQDVPDTMMKTMRASNLIWGPLLDRFSFARIPMPGGCRIGSRPMDLHIKGMRKLGVEVAEHGGVIVSHCKNRKGNDLYLDFPSVGATENLVMAAVKTRGETMIRNAAREPEVADLCSFLVACGAKIAGIGSDTLYISGVEKLYPTEYEIIPDRIVGGTLLLAAALTGGDVTIGKIRPEHIEAVTMKMAEAGVAIEGSSDSLRVKGGDPLRAVDLKTMPYPGFPTDIQPQFMAAMTQAEGASVICESIFENRFGHCTDLNRMGADIKVDGRWAVVRGGTHLEGTDVEASDLRGGAALILAGLAAEGETVVHNASFIERGYCNLEAVFNELGARIERVE